MLLLSLNQLSYLNKDLIYLIELAVLHNKICEAAFLFALVRIGIF
jgi:hypothetical protein